MKTKVYCICVYVVARDRLCVVVSVFFCRLIVVCQNNSCVSFLAHGSAAPDLLYSWYIIV